MDPEHARIEGSPPHTGGPADAAGGSPNGDASHEGRWRRVLLLVWVGLMTAVVVTGLVGFLVYFFLLVR